MKKFASIKSIPWILISLASFRLLPTLVIYDGQGIFGQAPVFMSDQLALLVFFIAQFIGIVILLFVSKKPTLKEPLLYFLIGSNALVLMGSFAYEYGNPIANMFYNIAFLSIGFIFVIWVSHGYDLVYLITSSVINILLILYFISLKQNAKEELLDSDERLLSIKNPEYKGGSSVETDSMGEAWVLAVPGNPDLKLATAELHIWAKKGYIKTDTLLTEISTKRVYPATQIPGVFSTRTYLLASLLSFFLGVLGIDRLYMGYIGTGLIKMFTFGGLGIWALIDFIRILTRNLPDKNGLPLS